MNDRLPFTLLSHTGSPVGYSEVAALLFRSLLEIGVEVHYQCLSDDYIYEAGSYDMIVNAMRKVEPERKQPWVSLTIAPMFWLNGGDYKVGWSMMEVDKIDSRWVRACNGMDEIWVPTRLQVDMFRRCGVEKPIYVVPLGIDTTRYMPTFLPFVYHGKHNFRFFSLSWWQERKRWDLLNIAFAEEFGADKDVALLMKTMTAQGEGEAVDQIHQWVGHRMDSQIALIEGAFPWWEIVMMMRSAHAFVLPTAGEGWGCPPVQALACGLPVIVTDCQGPGEVLRDAAGKPFPGVLFLPARKEPTGVHHEYYEGGNWWVPDVADIRAAMREVKENYAHWKEQALIGADMVRRDRSGLVMASAVKSRLTEIYREKGF
jgi:glycosyltransferase involved in cell wall biosynthesis